MPSARWPAFDPGDDEVPARGGLGVDHQVLHDAHAHAARGEVPERVHVGRQVEVVVDGLGNVHDAKLAARGLRQPVGAEAVSSPPMVTSLVTPSLRSGNSSRRQPRAGIVRALIRTRRVGARGPDQPPPSRWIRETSVMEKGGVATWPSIKRWKLFMIRTTSQPRFRASIVAAEKMTVHPRGRNCCRTGSQLPTAIVPATGERQRGSYPALCWTGGQPEPGTRRARSAGDGDRGRPEMVTSSAGNAWPDEPAAGPAVMDDPDRAGRTVQQRLCHGAEQHPEHPGADRSADHDELRILSGIQQSGSRCSRDDSPDHLGTGCSGSSRYDAGELLAQAACLAEDARRVREGADRHQRNAAKCRLLQGESGGIRRVRRAVDANHDRTRSGGDALPFPRERRSPFRVRTRQPSREPSQEANRHPAMPL